MTPRCLWDFEFSSMVPLKNKGGKLAIFSLENNMDLKGWGLWFFVSFRIFFSDNTRIIILIFFCRAKREYLFQNSTLGYMTKTLNQIFFPPPRSEYFFQQHWESEYFFSEKNHNPLQVKWSFPNSSITGPLMYNLKIFIKRFGC